MKKNDVPDNIVKAFNILKNSEELALLKTALTKVFIEFDIDYQEFKDDLGAELINTLLEETQSKGVVMSRTGLSHRAVAKAIQHKDQPPINLKRNMLYKAFSEINTYCQHHETAGMPKFLFYANMRSYNDGKTSTQAHLDKLFDTGIIRQDKEYVYLELEKSVQKRYNEELVSILGVVVNNLVNTISYNKNRDPKDDPLFQMYIQSSQIPPDLAPLVQRESLAALRVFYKQMTNLLTKYEDEVACGTFPTIGFSMFQYNDNVKPEE